MKHFKNSSMGTATTRRIRGLFAALCLLVPFVAAEGMTPPGGLSAGGEDTGTLPAVAQTPTGLRLMGPLRSVAQTVTGISGKGQVRVLPLDTSDPSQPVLVSFEGNLNVEFDRTLLANGNVGVFFGTQAGIENGLLALSIENQMGAPAPLAGGQMVYLPMGRIYGPDQLATPTITLHAFSTSFGLFQATATTEGNRLLMSQRLTDVARRY